MTGLGEGYGFTSLSPSVPFAGWDLGFKERAGGAGDPGSVGGTVGPGGRLGGKFSNRLVSLPIRLISIRLSDFH